MGVRDTLWTLGFSKIAQTTPLRVVRGVFVRGRGALPGAMTVPRAPLLVALLVLLLTAGVCKQNAAHVTPGASAEARTDGRNLLGLIMEKARLTRPPKQDEVIGLHTTRKQEVSLGTRENDEVTGLHATRKQEVSLGTREKDEVNRSHHGERTIKVFPRDLRQKEKFIKHLTGPLYFNPKCRKHFYRLYHNTRDCTVPACWPGVRGAQRGRTLESMNERSALESNRELSILLGTASVCSAENSCVL
ncbi:ALK and LTK ligand 2 [Esox lucius]|nr:ALK and LTK ligand 2 [Esox lucius]